VAQSKPRLRLHRWPRTRNSMIRLGHAVHFLPTTTTLELAQRASTNNPQPLPSASRQATSGKQSLETMRLPQIRVNARPVRDDKELRQRTLQFGIYSQVRKLQNCQASPSCRDVALTFSLRAGPMRSREGLARRLFVTARQQCTRPTLASRPAQIRARKRLCSSTASTAESVSTMFD
jgi:hypothetical protein